MSIVHQSDEFSLGPTSGCVEVVDRKDRHWRYDSCQQWWVTSLLDEDGVYEDHHADWGYLLGLFGPITEIDSSTT
jgi:hypothetical protein